MASMTLHLFIAGDGRKLALVVLGGLVVRASSPDYVGMDEAAAVSGATSVMRWRLGTEPHPTSADGYPEHTTLELLG